MSHCLRVQAQQTPIRIMVLDWSLLGVIMNDGLCPAGWAFETEGEMTHQTLVTASWPPLA